MSTKWLLLKTFCFLFFFLLSAEKKWVILQACFENSLFQTHLITQDYMNNTHGRKKINVSKMTTTKDLLFSFFLFVICRKRSVLFQALRTLVIIEGATFFKIGHLQRHLKQLSLSLSLYIYIYIALCVTFGVPLRK